MWDVFISHASEDKSSFVAPLAEEIERRGYRVWYDKFTLKWGDSLRQSIERGLDQSQYGIVVLSKAFFRKRWPQTELDALIEKEAKGKKVILPIWHEVDEDEVRKHSGLLAGRLALPSSIGVEAIVDELSDLVGEPETKLRKEPVSIEVVRDATLPDLEVLAKNLWWEAQKNPNAGDKIAGTLERVFNQIRGTIVVSELAEPPRNRPTTVAHRTGASRYDEFVARGRSGSPDDVDFLMEHLVESGGLASSKLVDFALGLVQSKSGRDAIERYLFNGQQKQRNFAALYFKRLGDNEILNRAVKAGKIDRKQAFAK